LKACLPLKHRFIERAKQNKLTKTCLEKIDFEIAETFEDKDSLEEQRKITENMED